VFHSAAALWAIGLSFWIESGTINHHAISKNLVQVEQKFTAEDVKSFHLILPRFLTSIILGLFISPLHCEVRKGKGHIWLDCTNGQNPIRAPNSSFPKPSANNADNECPTVYCSDAFQRHLVQLWRMCIARPVEDILQHCDDIDSAFRRIPYHPDLYLISPMSSAHLSSFRWAWCLEREMPLPTSASHQLFLEPTWPFM
jgi:hypothetical protein